MHPPGGTGRPPRPARRGSVDESATIPCELTEAERADSQGAEVLVHSAGWRGRVLSRPEPNEPLLVTGYGRMREWVGPGSHNMYVNRDWMSKARPDVGIGLTVNSAAFGLENDGSAMKITQRPGTVCDSGDSAGYIYWSGHQLDRLVFDVEIGHPDIELVVRSLRYIEGAASVSTIAYSKSGVGTYTGQTAYLTSGDFTGRGIGIYASILTTPSNPVRSDKFVRIFNARLIGRYIPEHDTSVLVRDILGEPASPYITLTPEPFDVMEFDAWSPAARKMSELMKAYHIEYGEYDGLDSDGMPATRPYVFDRPEEPAYLLRLEDCVSLPKIEHARLDELTSGTIVMYRDASNYSKYIEAADSDTTHPLVRMGLTRYGVIDIGSTAAYPYDAAATANADNGRPRIKGEATTDRLLTITGAPADHARVKCGEVVRVEWLGIDARIERIEWRGRYITLTLDNEPYRLDMMLAKLAQRE
jgi:hypothetical protein